MKIRFVFVDYCYLGGGIIFLASNMHFWFIYTNTFVFDSRGLSRTFRCSS